MSTTKNGLRVAELKALTREGGLRDYSQLRKAELIAVLHPALQTRPQRPTRPPPPPLSQTRRVLQAEVQLVKFRPDRPRQPELLRQLEERN